MTRKEAEQYLGISDNENKAYKDICVSELKRLQMKYAGIKNVAFWLIDDLGIYVKPTKIIEQGEFVAAVIE